MDRSRLTYSLAGAMLAGEWSADALKQTTRRWIAGRRVPGLVQRIVAAFAEKPAYGLLARFLRADAGLTRALGRPVLLVTSRVRSRRAPQMDQRPARLGGVELPAIATEAALAEWFGVSVGRLRWLADPSGRNRKHPPGPLRPYRYRWVARRGGPQDIPRLLEIPKTPLKQMQRKILDEILGPVPVHPAAHGFCAGRSIVTNAAAHCGKPTVLHFDLTDFFPSVTSARVFQTFRTLGYPEDVARLLTGLCTTSLPADVWESRPGAAGAVTSTSHFAAWQRLKGRHLPQGAPTSPALANLAAGRLDRRLSGLAAAAGAAYTRYADDLTFSGCPDLARSRRRLAVHVAAIAAEEGFTLNHRKTRLMRAGSRQRVTGVVVNVRPNITRADFDRLKAVLTNCVRHGPASQNRTGVPDFRAHLTGQVAHLASIHPARGAKLKAILLRIRWEGAAGQ